MRQTLVGGRDLLWAPLLVGAFGTLVTLALWQAVDEQGRAGRERTVRLAAHGAGAALRDRMRGRVEALDRLARQIAREGPGRPGPWSDALLREECEPGYEAVAWIGLGEAARFGEPRTGRSVDLAARLGGPPFQPRLLDLGEGDPALVVPAGRPDRLLGMVVATLRPEEILRDWLREASVPGYSLAVSWGARGLYTQDEPRDRDRRGPVTEQDVDLYGATWRVRAWPVPERLAATGSWATLAVLPFGFLASALLALAIGRLQVARERSRVAERALQDLMIAGAERDRARDEMARTNEELQRFACMVSHDLQEPLRTVANFVQLLGRRHRDRLDNEAQEFIDFAVEGSSRMQQLIAALLTYARLGTGPKAFKPVDCGEICDEAIANLGAAIDESGASVVRGDLPTVMADRVQAVQLFQNLIGNAIKYRGKNPAEVRIGADRRDGEWVLFVKDNGIGFDPRDSDRIFMIFQRLHRRGEYPGTGVGLALCKKIIEHHGGRIWVRSRPGQGSVFSFILPAALEAQAPSDRGAIPSASEVRKTA